MSKSSMTVLWIVVIAILAVLLIWGIGSGGSFGLFSGSFGTAGLETSTYFEREASQVRELYLSLSSEDVRIEPGDGDQVTVEQTIQGNAQEQDKIRCGMKDGALLVESGRMKSGGCTGNFSPPYSQVMIRIPKDCIVRADVSNLSGNVVVTDMEFADCSMSAASGNISFRQINAHACSVETLSGDIELQEGTFESLHCEAASGNIVAEAQTSGDVSLKSMSGEQSYKGTCGTLDGETASGGLQADVRGATEIQVESMSGDVELSCPDVSGLRSIEAGTASGNVSVLLPKGSTVAIDFESSSGSLQTDEADGVQIGDAGAVHLDVSTSSGDLILMAT